MTFIPYTIVPIAGFLLFQASGLPGGEWGSLGVGGALAGLMFYFYRMDRQASDKMHEERRIASDKMHEERNQEATAALDRNSNALQNNASTMAKVAALIEGWDRRRPTTP